jgi:hypothetical protein
VIIKHKAATAKIGDEGNTLDAFVALGGNADKTGKISTDKLRATIKVRPVQPLQRLQQAQRPWQALLWCARRYTVYQLHGCVAASRQPPCMAAC